MSRLYTRARNWVRLLNYQVCACSIWCETLVAHKISVLSSKYGSCGSNNSQWECRKFTVWGLGQLRAQGSQFWAPPNYIPLDSLSREPSSLSPKQSFTMCGDSPNSTPIDVFHKGPSGPAPKTEVHNLRQCDPAGKIECVWNYLSWHYLVNIQMAIPQTIKKKEWGAGSEREKSITNYIFSGRNWEIIMNMRISNIYIIIYSKALTWIIMNMIIWLMIYEWILNFI